MRPIVTEFDVDQLGRQVYLFAVIAGWDALGLFEILQDRKPRTLSELPGDERALTITARILAHAGILVGQGGRWAMSESAAGLYKEGPLRLAGSLDRFSDLSRIVPVLKNGEAVKDASGKSRVTTVGVREDDVEGTHRFMQMLYRRSEQSAEETFRWTHTHLKPGARVLDLGGGHGRYARVFADHGFDAVLFDFQMCLDFAQGLHADTLTYLAGDFFTDELGGPYDAVLVSNIIHGISPKESLALLKRLRAVMNPGGVIVVKDMFVDDFENSPEVAVMFGLTMLMYTEGGTSYTLSEMHKICEDAGFEPIAPAVLEHYALVMAKAS